MITILFLLGSLLVPNNKILFIWTGIYLLLQLMSTKSFIMTIASVFIPISIMTVGQLYVFQAIPKGGITSNIMDYSEGRQLFFTLSPFFVLELTVIIGIIIVCLSKGIKFLRTNIPLLLLLLVSLFSVISSFKSEFLPSLSFFYTIRSLGWISWVWILRSYFNNVSKKEKLSVLNLIMQQIVVVGLFICLIVFAQFLLRSPLGLTIEGTEILPVFGLGADENPLQFRPVGLFSHANILANSLFVLLLSFIFLKNFMDKYKRTRVFSNFFVLSMVVAIILTLSRAVYLSTFVYFIGVFLMSNNRGLFIEKIKVFIKKITDHKLFSYPFLLLLFLLLLDRSVHTLLSFGGSGGMTVRSRLMELSFSLITKYSFLGVGRGMFIPAAFALDPKGIISSFPESVHNGFILMLVESGFVGLLLNLLFLFSLVASVIYSKNSFLQKKSTLLGLFSLFLIMLFHPFINIVVLYTLLIVMVV